MTHPLPAVVLDTETTTNKDTPERRLEVIELAFRHLGSDDTTVFRYRPERMSTWGALAVHNILPEELDDCPASARVTMDFPLADFWIGHNIDFDWKALGSPKVKRICTLALARSLWPELDSHSLTALTYYTKGANPATRKALRSAHSAAADIAFTLDLYNLQCELLKTTSLERMWDYSEAARIPKIMTFGKFRGQPISAVDRGYAAWYNRQPDPDEYLLRAFRLAGLLK
jgi:exodeoxyribonuclease X